MMHWLDEAWSEGVANARNPEREFQIKRNTHNPARQKFQSQEYSAEFKNEQVTAKDVSDFLDQYMAPVLVVLHDLREFSCDTEHRDFIVGELKDDFFYAGDSSGEWRDPFAAQYALTKRESSFRGSTDYEVKEDYFFGRESEIRHWTNEYFTYVRLFPRTSNTTHYAGVEYQTGAHSHVVWAGEDLSPVIKTLQTVIGSWYAYYIEKQARYFKW